MADSQLLRVLGDPSPNGRRLSVDATWSNLGPVTDFCIAELDGRQQVVTCSGVGRTGSLRSVRIGVSVTELGVSDGFHGVLGMWSLGGVGSVEKCFLFCFRRYREEMILYGFPQTGVTLVLSFVGVSYASMLWQDQLVSCKVLAVSLSRVVELVTSFT